MAILDLTNNWETPTQATVDTALTLIKSLEKANQRIYHTAPGPVGEIMINLRNGDKSIELLVYAKHQKFVRLGTNEGTQKGLLTDETLQALLGSLNQ
jgi:hypothetical protein